MAKPKFLDEELNEKITGAERGTLMHLCVQKMDENKDYGENSIKAMIEDLVAREVITRVQADNINVKKLLKYTKSDLWASLKCAKEVYKEQPFYINIPAESLYNLKNSKDENVLVQGIIDLYFIDENNKLVLVDYKTDYVEYGKENELVKKYETQLELYKNALEQAMNRKVDKIGIYSLYLNKFVEM